MTTKHGGARQGAGSPDDSSNAKTQALMDFLDSMGCKPEVVLAKICNGEPILCRQSVDNLDADLLLTFDQCALALTNTPIGCTQWIVEKFLMEVVMANIEGTLGSNTINGTGFSDLIFADDAPLGWNPLLRTISAGGGDTINGMEGNDDIYAQGGSDTIDGGEGHDEIYGDDGDDQISGDILTHSSGFVLGNDVIYGGNGNDLIFADSYTVVQTYVTTNYLDGGAGNDTMRGGFGADTLLGGEGDDTLYGRAGDDSLVGGAGDDTLAGDLGVNGFDGDDTMLGGLGDDDLVGMKGDDTYQYDGNGSDIVIEGGNGTGGDTLQLLNIAFSSNIFDDFFYVYDEASNDDLIIAETEADYMSNNFITLQNYFLGGTHVVENMTGSAGSSGFVFDLTGSFGSENNDFLTNDGSQNNRVLVGFGGDDTLKGGGSGDTLDGGSGADKIDGLAGDDFILGGSGNDTIDGAVQDDTIDGGSGDDLITGGEGNDQLSTGEGNDTLSGGIDDDLYMFNESGTAQLTETSGIDILQFTLSDISKITGTQSGNNLVFSSSLDSSYTATIIDYYANSAKEIEILADVDGDAILLTSRIDNGVIDGTSGDDLLTGTSGIDEINGADGADTLDGGIGQDRLTGGAGADIFKFSNVSHSVDDGGALDNLYDRISDFVVGEDVIDLSGLGFYGFDVDGGTTEAAELRMSVSGSGKTYLKSDQNGFTVQLNGDYSATLTAADIIFDAIPVATITGSASAEILTGVSGNEFIDGLAGDDTLDGGAWNDTLDGGAGQDRLTGGSGADVFKVSDVSHSIDDNGANNNLYDRITDFVVGEDMIDLSGLGFYGFDTDGGGTETGELRMSVSGSGLTYLKSDQNGFSLQLSGDYSATLTAADIIFDAIPVATITGSASAEILTGVSGNEFIDGLAGDDTLDGGAWNDTLDGGADEDKMTGGSGEDTFRFSSLSDSLHSGGLYDRITDFDVADDTLDVSGLGFSSLVFGVSTTSTVLGELLVHYSTGSDRTYVSDKNFSDFEFYLDGDYMSTLSSSDFIFV